jgi:hypothetical protein
MIEEEIEREVQALDRKTVSDRAKYFEERLGIDWCGGHFLSFVSDAIELRNRLLHLEPDLQVSDAEVGKVRWITSMLPYYCCLKGSERFPAAFPGWISKTVTAEIPKHSN